jgi:hypothetical protein
VTPYAADRADAMRDASFDPLNGSTCTWKSLSCKQLVLFIPTQLIFSPEEIGRNSCDELLSHQIILLRLADDALTLDMMVQSTYLISDVLNPILYANHIALMNYFYCCYLRRV